MRLNRIGACGMSEKIIPQHSLLAELQSNNRACGHCPTQRNKKWKPLATNDLKTNFDGAMFLDSNEARIGVRI